MMESHGFGAGPDRELGALLQEALTGPDGDVFLARLAAAVARAERESSWEVLARWAPAGLVAAVAAALVMWLVVRPVADPGPGSLAAVPAQMEVAPGQPEADVLTVGLLEGR